VNAGSSKNPITITSSSPVKDTSWIKNLSLSFDDKARIETPGGWLNDAVVNAAQQMLQQQSGLCGFQNTQYGKDYRFKHLTGKFVQVLNVHRSHWITVSNIGCEADTVNVYDGAYAWLDLDTKKQLCAVIRLSKYLIANMINIQHQSNGSDCGLFALACATELAHMPVTLFCHSGM